MMPTVLVLTQVTKAVVMKKVKSIFKIAAHIFSRNLGVGVHAAFLFIFFLPIVSILAFNVPPETNPFLFVAQHMLILTVIMYGFLIAVGYHFYRDHLIMQNFAEKYGYQIDKKTAHRLGALPRKLEDRPGTLFYDKREAALNNKVTGGIDGFNLNVFQYLYWVSRQGQRHVTVFQLDIGTRLPHIYLDNLKTQKLMDDRGGLRPYSRTRVGAVEFGSNYQALVQPGLGQELFVVFDEELMHKLNDCTDLLCDFEVVDRYLYAYYPAVASLEEMTRIHQILESLAPQLEKLRNYKMPKYPEKPEVDLKKVNQL